MTPPLAIIAGNGALPAHLWAACRAEGREAHLVRIHGTAPEGLEGVPGIDFTFEGFGALFDALHARGCRAVVFAGGMRRSVIDPARFDAKSRAIAPRLLPLIGGGDDGILREIAAVFSDEGFTVEAAHDIAPDLLAGPGALGGHAPGPGDHADIARAAGICTALGRADLGQAVVVAGGLCLGVETVQGTDALLAFVASTRADAAPITGGVLLKAPKPGQDRRFDLPAIGPNTVTLAHRAGLAGIAVAAGGALLLERAETVARADKLGLFVYGVAEEGG